MENPAKSEVNRDGGRGGGGGQRRDVMGNFIRVQEALPAWFLVQVQVSYCLYDLLCHLSLQHFRKSSDTQGRIFHLFQKNASGLVTKHVLQSTWKWQITGL